MKKTKQNTTRGKKQSYILTDTPYFVKSVGHLKVTCNVLMLIQFERRQYD